MLNYVQFLTDVLIGRVQDLRSAERRERGASALEWAIIAAIAVVIASIVGYAVYNAVNNQTATIDKCGSQPVGSPGCK